MVADAEATPITVLVDGRVFSGHYRRLAGNRIEVYTQGTSWMAFIGPQRVEDLAKDMLAGIARLERSIN